MINANKAYSDIEISTDVLTASSHRLIQLMLDKCAQHIELTKTYIMVNDISKKAHSISKALDIVEYLRLCLNHDDEKAKELSALLDSLYAYMQENLMQANVTNNIKFLDEAKKVLMEIKSGWDGISESV